MPTATSAGVPAGLPSHAGLKYAVLKHYVLPYAMMAGAKVRGSRAVVLDGYAGPGRIHGGDATAAEWFLRAARETPRTTVEILLIEADRDHFRQLYPLVGDYQFRGVRCEARFGTAAEHLTGVVQQAVGVPLFFFLDPFTSGLPYDVLGAVLADTRSGSWPPTEGLLRFDTARVRRAIGLNRAHPQSDRGEDPAVAALDSACGGAWWRQVAADAHAAAPEQDDGTTAVVAEYGRRLAAAGEVQVETVPVRRRLHHPPTDYLVFVSRSAYSRWVFGAALAVARQDWMHSLGPAADDDDGPPFSVDDSVDRCIEREQTRIGHAIAENLRALVVDRGGVRLGDDPRAVLGGAYGVATDGTVRWAVQELVVSGEIALVGEAKHTRDLLVVPARSGPARSHPPRPRLGRPGI